MLPKFMNTSDIGLKNNNCLSVRGIGTQNNFQLSGHLRNRGPVKEKCMKRRIHQKNNATRDKT